MSISLGPFAKVADLKFGALKAGAIKIGTATVLVDLFFDGWIDEGRVFYDLGHYGSPRLQMQKHSATSAPAENNTVALPGGGGTIRQAGGDGSLPWLTLTSVPAMIYANGFTKVAFAPFYSNTSPVPGAQLDGYGMSVFSRGDVYGVVNGTADYYGGQDYPGSTVASGQVNFSATPLTPLFPILRENLHLCGEVLQITDDGDHVLWQSMPAVQIDIDRTLAAVPPSGLAPPLLVYGWLDSPTVSQLIDTWTSF